MWLLYRMRGSEREALVSCFGLDDVFDFVVSYAAVNHCESQQLCHYLPSPAIVARPKTIATTMTYA